MNSKTPLLLGIVAAVYATTGCMAESFGGGLSIVNETTKPLVVFQRTVESNGGSTMYETTNCSNRDLVATTKDGKVVAELTEEWCPGQTWTITGEGQSTLEDDG